MVPARSSGRLRTSAGAPKRCSDMVQQAVLAEGAADSPDYGGRRRRTYPVQQRYPVRRLATHKEG
jgi:hypothetical protein